MISERLEQVLSLRNSKHSGGVASKLSQYIVLCATVEVYKMLKYIGAIDSARETEWKRGSQRREVMFELCLEE